MRNDCKLSEQKMKAYTITYWTREFVLSRPKKTRTTIMAYDKADAVIRLDIWEKLIIEIKEQ